MKSFWSPPLPPLLSSPPVPSPNKPARPPARTQRRASAHAHCRAPAARPGSLGPQWLHRAACAGADEAGVCDAPRLLRASPLGPRCGRSKVAYAALLFCLLAFSAQRRTAARGARSHTPATLARACFGTAALTHPRPAHVCRGGTGSAARLHRCDVAAALVQIASSGDDAYLGRYGTGPAGPRPRLAPVELRPRVRFAPFPSATSELARAAVCCG